MILAKQLRALSIILILVLIVGCRKTAVDEIDFGTISNSVYTNKYFAMAVAIPSKWSVQDQEAVRRLSKAGIKAIAGEDKNLPAIVKASEMTTVNLFAVFEHPLGAPVAFNPSVMAVAERVAGFPGIRSGKDYLFHARKLLESGQMKFAFPREVYSEQLSGTEFDVMELEMKIAGKTVNQKYFSTIKKGYALAFIISYTTDEEERSVRSVLDSVTFH